jgi:hypothetical protein
VQLAFTLTPLWVTAEEFDNTTSLFREKTISFQVVVETVTKARTLRS